MSDASSKRMAKKKLLTISRRLGSIPSLGYALIYLLMIPVFATIYCVLPSHFYHSTIQYEHSFTMEKLEIERELANELVTRFVEAHQGYETNVGRWNIKIIYPGFHFVHSLRISNNDVSFRMRFRITDREKETASELARPLIRFHLLPHSYPSGNKSIGEKRFILIEELTENLPVTPAERVEIARAIFPFDYENRPPSDLEYMPTEPTEPIILTMSSNLAGRLLNFGAASNGFPSDISGNFVRMFYLSAVTITTLGYGDVLPLTTTSRLLVSVEAILGIVLIGLFLNALWYEGKSEEKC